MFQGHVLLCSVLCCFQNETAVLTDKTEDIPCGLVGSLIIAFWGSSSAHTSAVSSGRAFALCLGGPGSIQKCVERDVKPNTKQKNHPWHSEHGSCTTNVYRMEVLCCHMFSSLVPKD